MTFDTTRLTESDLEVLAKMGITRDKEYLRKLEENNPITAEVNQGGSAYDDDDSLAFDVVGLGTDREHIDVYRRRKGNLRVTHQNPKTTQFVSTSELDVIDDAIVGYRKLTPEILGQGYSPVELIHLAAAAAYGLPNEHTDYAHMQETLIQLLDVQKLGEDGQPSNEAKAAYFDHNEELQKQGKAPVYPEQFIAGAAETVDNRLAVLERDARALLEGARQDIRVSPIDAFYNIVEAHRMLKVVATVKPVLEEARVGYEMEELLSVI